MDEIQCARAGTGSDQLASSSVSTAVKHPHDLDQSRQIEKYVFCILSWHSKREMGKKLAMQETQTLLQRLHK